jgi:hypothetical protein
MNKLAKISFICLILSLLFKFGVEMYLNRGMDYPQGPTINGEELFVDVSTNTFYTSPDMSKGNLFTGISVRYHINGEMLAKAGVKEGKLHGPFDSWYENGQKQMSLIWDNGIKFRRFRAYLSNGNEIEGDGNELGRKIFSGEIVLQ